MNTFHQATTFTVQSDWTHSISQHSLLCSQSEHISPVNPIYCAVRLNTFHQSAPYTVQSDWNLRGLTTGSRACGLAWNLAIAWSLPSLILPCFMKSRKLQIPEQYFDLPQETARKHVTQHLPGHLGVIMPQRDTGTNTHFNDCTLLTIHNGVIMSQWDAENAHTLQWMHTIQQGVITSQWHTENTLYTSMNAHYTTWSYRVTVTHWNTCTHNWICCVGSQGLALVTGINKQSSMMFVMKFETLE